MTRATDPIRRRLRALERWDRWMRNRHAPLRDAFRRDLHARCSVNGDGHDYHERRDSGHNFYMRPHPPYMQCVRCGHIGDDIT